MKLNLKDITNTLNRDEMKKIMAGSGEVGNCSTQCWDYVGNRPMWCKTGPSGCYCPGAGAQSCG
jgi:hypothetical protein